MDREKKLMDHDIIDYINHTMISALDSMVHLLLVIQTISGRSEGGQVPGLNRPLTQ